MYRVIITNNHLVKPFGIPNHAYANENPRNFSGTRVEGTHLDFQVY